MKRGLLTVKTPCEQDYFPVHGTTSLWVTIPLCGQEYFPVNGNTSVRTPTILICVSMPIPQYPYVWPMTPKFDTATWTFWGLSDMQHGFLKDSDMGHGSC